MRTIVDLSSYNGVPNFADLKARGAEGVIIKATEGHWTFTNPFFDQQVAGAKAQGLPIGFYSFVHPGDAGTSDAQLFLDKIAPHTPQLGLWLDCEVSDGVDPVTTFNRILADAQLIRAKYPFRCGIYTAAWWWNPSTSGSIAAHIDQLMPLWVAGYTQSLPALPAPWKAAIMWQFTDNWQGLSMDASYFLGTDAQWTYLVTGAIPQPPNFTDKTKTLQAALHLPQTGVFDAETDKRCMVVREMRIPTNHLPIHADRVKYLQQVMAFPGNTANGIWDDNTHAHWTETVKKVQAALGCPVTGLWDVPTDYSFLVLDPIR